MSGGLASDLGTNRHKTTDIREKIVVKYIKIGDTYARKQYRFAKG